MRNIRMILQYEGTRYQGWQKQIETSNTIQGKLEELLSKMTGEAVALHGSGRTDAGVHARCQVANFHTDSDLKEIEILNYVNRYLPEDIRVLSVEEVDGRFHSRLHAREKTYLYRVHNDVIADVFTRRFTYLFSETLDVEVMRRAAVLLCGTHDYSSFCANKRMKKSTVRTISEIRVERVGKEIQMTYRGSGFLHHMVRIMTGTLLEAGTGRREPESMAELLALKDRKCAGMLVPGQGLMLVDVRY